MTDFSKKISHIINGDTCYGCESHCYEDDELHYCDQSLAIALHECLNRFEALERILLKNKNKIPDDIIELIYNVIS